MGRMFQNPQSCGNGFLRLRIELRRLERIPIVRTISCGAEVNIRWEESHRGRCRCLPKGHRRVGGPFSATWFQPDLTWYPDGDGVPQVHLLRALPDQIKSFELRPYNQMGPFVRGALLAGVCRGARTGECLE